MDAQANRRWAWAAALFAVFALAALWTLVFAAKITEPFVWPDELTYAKEATHIWELHRFLVPSDSNFNSWAQLQPVLMAPFFGTMSTQGAYHAIHVLNSLLLASTAFPAYLLARRVVVSRPASLGVAVLCVVTPWMTLAGTMMTEVVAFPVFAWTLLALQRAVAVPSMRAEVVALAMLALAFVTRTQFIALAPAFAVAVAVQELRFRGLPPKELARRHAPLIGAIVLALLVLVVSGSNSTSLFGSYSRTASNGLLPPGTIRWALESLAYVAVAIAIVPLALSLAFSFQQLARPDEPEQHAFAALLVATLLFFGYVTGVFGTQYTAGIQDRYVYFLVVPLFVGAAAWVTGRRPAPLALAVGGLFAAWVVYRSALSLRGPSLVSPSAAWHQVIFGKVSELNHRLGSQWLTGQKLMAGLTIAACAVLFGARRLRPEWRAVAIVLLGGLALYTVVETRYTMSKIAAHEVKRSDADWAQLDWVDDALPGDVKAPVLLSDMGSEGDAQAIWWHVQFWNRKAAPAYTFDENILAQSFPQNAVLDDKRGRIEQLAGKRFAIHALPDRRFQLQGAKQLQARDSVELVSLPGTGRVDWALDAESQNGLVPVRRPARLRVFPPSSGAAQEVTLSLTTNFQTAGDYRYRLTGPGVRRSALVKVGKSATETFDVRVPANGFAEFKLAASGPVHPDYPLGGLLITDLKSSPLR